MGRVMDMGRQAGRQGGSVWGCAQWEGDEGEEGRGCTQLGGMQT